MHESREVQPYRPYSQVGTQRKLRTHHHTMLQYETWKEKRKTQADRLNQSSSGQHRTIPNLRYTLPLSSVRDPHHMGSESPAAPMGAPFLLEDFGGVDGVGGRTTIADPTKL